MGTGINAVVKLLYSFLGPYINSWRACCKEWDLFFLEGEGGRADTEPRLRTPMHSGRSAGPGRSAGQAVRLGAVDRGPGRWE